MTALTIESYRDVLGRIYNNYGLSAEQIANIAQSISTALLNTYTDHNRTPKAHFHAWKAVEAEMREYIGFVTGERQDILHPECAEKLTGELFQ